MAFKLGTAGADNIAINDIFDFVIAGDGNDKIADNDANPFGIDLVFGGKGDDTFVAGKGLNFFAGGDGSDTVDYSKSSVGVNVDLASGVGIGEGLDILDSVENVKGSSKADNISGDDGANVIEAGDGADKVAAGKGDDQVDGGKGDDELRGQQGKDSLNGGEGNDTLRGGSGNDVLDGGLGKDVLNGGSGNDVYFYNSAAESTAAASDEIKNFDIGQDKIDLSSLDANTGKAGNQAFDVVAFDATKPLEAGQVTSHFDAATNRTIVEAFNGTDTLHTEIDGNVALTQTDYVL